MAANPTQASALPGKRPGLQGKNIQRYAIIGIMLLMAVVSTILTNGDFASPRNLVNIAVQVTTNGILAVGMTFIVATGGTDLGAGSLLALIGVILAKLMGMGLGTVPAVALAMLVAVGVGLWNGSFVARFNLPPFIVTLGTMTAARGLALLISGGRALSPLTPEFNLIASTALPRVPSLILVAVMGLWIVYSFVRASKSERSLASLLVGLLAAGFGAWVLSSETVRGIPTPVLVFAAVAALGSFLLNRTTFGRHVLAIGGNVNAARFSGINVRWTIIKNFMLAGFTCGIGALVLASRLSSGVPTAGNMAEMDAIAAVVIGGTPVSGGSGSISGTIIGVIIIGMLNNVLVILNVDSNFQYIVKGLVILGAVLLDASTKKNKN